ncbi:N-acetylglucosamine-regulated TonB-dependent outer membrane receptor, partial [hydrothermal vent metagenome]
PDFGNISQATVDANNTVTSYQGSINERIVNFVRPRFAKTREVGFNVEWQANDNLSAVWDGAYSKSTDTTAGNQAWFDANLNTFDPTKITYQQSPSGLPSYTNLGDLSDTSKATFGWFTWEGRSIKDETYQSTFDLAYDFDDAGVLTSIRAGASYAQREKNKTVAKTPGNVQCLFCGVPLPQNLFSTVNSRLLNDGLSNNSFPSYSVSEVEKYFLSDVGLNAAAVNKAGPGADAAAIATALVDIKATIAANGGTLGVQPVLGSGGGVKEKNYSAYIQANFEGNLGETPWSANMGLRYIRSDVRSTGFGQELIRIDTPNNGDPVPVFSPAQPIAETGSYHVLLPNLNVKVDASENIVLRFSVAKTLTRATLSDLTLARNFNVRARERNVSSGNPGLKPLIAWNYDTSITLYIDDASYMSVAWFRKDLSGGSSRVTQTIQLLGFDFFSTRPENRGNGVVNGVELTTQYTFSSLPAPFDGLGVQGNYTKVITGSGTNGQSESYNAVGFYQKGPIQARLAYAYRAGYLASAAANRGQPKNIRAYGQWDASVSYDLPFYGVTVFAEAINITNAQSLAFSVFQNRVIQLQDTGARYTAGVRVRF